MAEEDYMSDTFLRGLDDVRPGLKSRSQKRRDRASEPAKIEPKHKRMKASEHEAREKGLATHISSESKGFSMLQKMGYREGMGLGKKGAGMTTLIPLVLKAGKGGLGRESYVKERTVRRKTQESRRFTDFRLRKQDVFSQRRVEGDFRKSQRACEQLDTAKGISAPVEHYYWPPELVCTEEEEEEEEEEEGENEYSEEAEDEPEEDVSVDLSEQLDALTDYLRTEHFYCIWCGTTYEGVSDLTQHCPGGTAEAHED